MALDFQQVREQVKKLGEDAPARARERQERLEQALSALQYHAEDLDRIRQKVQYAVQNFDSTLRVLCRLKNP